MVPNTKKCKTRLYLIEHKGTGCNSFQTAQSHNGSRVTQNCDKKIKIYCSDTAQYTSRYRLGLTFGEAAYGKIGILQRRCGKLVPILGAISVVH